MEIEKKEEISTNEKVENAQVEQSSQPKQETSKVAKQDKKQDKKNNKKKKAKESKGPSKVAKTMSELKKVSWPSFGEVVKKTSVVLVVCLAFLLVIFGLDKLCSWLMGLICS